MRLLGLVLLAGCAVTRPLPGTPGQRVVDIIREEPHGVAWHDYKAYQNTKPTRVNMDVTELAQIGRTRIEAHEDGLVVVERRRQAADLPRITYRRRLPDAVRPLFAALDGVDQPVVYDFERWCQRVGRAPIGDDELCHHPTASRVLGELVVKEVLAPHVDATPGIVLRKGDTEVELHEDGGWRCVAPRAPGDLLVDEGHLTAVEAEPILRALEPLDETARIAAWNERAAPHLAGTCHLEAGTMPLP